MVTKEQVKKLSKYIKDDVYVEITDKAGNFRTVHYGDFLKEIEGMLNLNFFAWQEHETFLIYDESKSFFGTLDKIVRLANEGKDETWWHIRNE